MEEGVLNILSMVRAERDASYCETRIKWINWNIDKVLLLFTELFFFVATLNLILSLRIIPQQAQTSTNKFKKIDKKSAFL